MCGCFFLVFTFLIRACPWTRYYAFALTVAALINLITTLTLLGVVDACVRGDMAEQPTLVLAGIAASIAYILGLVMLKYEIEIADYST